MSFIRTSVVLVALMSLRAVLAEEKVSEALVPCTWEGIQELCEDIDQADKNGKPLSFGDGGELASREILEKQSETFAADRAALTAKQKKRLKEIFEKTINHAMASVRNGKTDEQLSPQEKNIIERLQTLTLSDLKSVASETACKDKTYVGVNPAQKELYVCPALANYPETALVQAMATYVGHYISPCVASFPIAKSAFRTIPPIGPGHPFEAVQTCLATGEIVPNPKNLEFNAQAKDEKNKAMKMRIEQQIERVARIAPQIKSYTPQRFFDEVVKPFPECAGNMTGGQMTSATNEWFSADVTGRYMKAENKSHPKNRQEQLANLAYIIDDACRFTKIKNIAAENGHPPHQVRFRDALFRSHRLREAMGCRASDFKIPACALSSNVKGSSADQRPAKGDAAPAQ
ncbi:MAG: hypothetical protein AB7N80_07870 [Bdellovibrionales bacterium]